MSIKRRRKNKIFLHWKRGRRSPILTYFELLHRVELEWIHWLHQMRTPFLDQLFQWLNFFDRPEFFFILIPVIWLGEGWKAGLRLFSILFLSGLANQILKELFASPRPFHLEPSLGILEVSGFGFPSGAAQNVILLSGLLVRLSKSVWKWGVALAYIGLVSLSRVYLGVHFPTDVLGGWLIGFCLLGMYLYIRPALERRLAKFKVFSLFLFSQALPGFFLLGRYSVPTMMICSIAMGLGMGLWVAHLYQLFPLPPQTSREYALRACIGVGGTFACYGVTLLLWPLSDELLYLFPRFFPVGLWGSLGSHLVCLRMLSQREPSLPDD